jgi:hypothetical protein
MTDALRKLDDALARLRDAGQVVPVWLRDDDAETATPALARLIDLAARMQVPVALAVVPARADQRLADAVAAAPGLVPAVHGWAHANHAPPSEKKRELGPDRPRPIVLAELDRALAHMAERFGDRLLPMLVPPWNRIDATLLPELPALGYRAVSTFGRLRAPAPLPQVNTHLDLMDWPTRRGRGLDDLAAALADEMTARLENDEPVGLLAHHLVHDETAWHALGALLARLADEPACRFVDPRRLV